MPEILPPVQVSGLPVVAAIRVPDSSPMATPTFVVITRNAYVPDERAYSVWTAWIRSDGLPVVGGYLPNLGWDAALDELSHRVRSLA